MNRILTWGLASTLFLLMTPLLSAQEQPSNVQITRSKSLMVEVHRPGQKEVTNVETTVTSANLHTQDKAPPSPGTEKAAQTSANSNITSAASSITPEGL